MRNICPARWWIEEHYIRQDKSLNWCSAQFDIPTANFVFFARKLGLVKRAKFYHHKKKNVQKNNTQIEVKYYVSKSKPKKTYGETIIERLNTLDFRLPIDLMVEGLYKNLPKRMTKQETLIYYTEKLNLYWG